MYLYVNVLKVGQSSLNEMKARASTLFIFAILLLVSGRSHSLRPLMGGGEGCYSDIPHHVVLDMEAWAATQSLESSQRMAWAATQSLESSQGTPPHLTNRRSWSSSHDKVLGIIEPLSDRTTSLSLESSHRAHTPPSPTLVKDNTQHVLIPLHLPS